MADLKIQILSRKLIKPSNPTPEHLWRYNLSLFDELAPAIYSPMLYYYLSEGDNGRARNDERCHKLEKSLSQILTKFYPLAGRFMEDELYVHCGDQGVECIQAQVNGKLANLLQPSDSQMHTLSKFLPWDVNTASHSSISPLVSVQINTFDCGGIILGIAISHIVTDAFTVFTFMNEWAKTSQKGMREDLGPSFRNLSSLFPVRNCLLPKAPPTSSSNAKGMTKMFLFEETKIASMKESLGAIDRPFSKVVVVTAMIWKALLEVGLAKRGSFRDSILVFLMNLRDKSEAAPSTQEITFGNYYIRVMILFEAKNSNAQLHDLMVLIRSAVEKERARFVGASTDDISSMCLKRCDELFKERRRSDVDFYIFSSVCRFPLYEADFGWGKPHWVSDACRGPYTIVLMDSKTGGIQAHLNLIEADMNKFQKNLCTQVSSPYESQSLEDLSVDPIET